MNPMQTSTPQNSRRGDKSSTNNNNEENEQNQYSSPALPSSSPSSPYDIYQRASDCLRKLQQDIAIFRDPTVRSHLQTLPIHSSSNTSPAKLPVPASAAEQKATIISLRTAVKEMEQNLRDMRENDLRTRKRAARAEGQLSELVTQRDATERTHQMSVAEAAARIRALEENGRDRDKRASEERRRLERELEEKRREIGTKSVQGDRERKRAERAEKSIKDMEDEMSAIRKANEAEVRVLRQSKIDADHREKELRTLLDRRTESIRRISGMRDGGEEAKVREVMEGENIKLKSEAEWMSAKIVKAEKRAEDMEREGEAMRLKMNELIKDGAEVHRLRIKVKDLEVGGRDLVEMKQFVNALQKEKNEMKKMIMALSLDGTDVEGGVKVLRTLGNRKEEKENLKAIFQRWTGGRSDSLKKSGDDDICMADKKDDVDDVLDDDDDDDDDDLEEEGDEEQSVSKKLNRELEYSRKRIESLETEVEALKDRIVAELTGVGPAEGDADYDPKVCKVFHLQDNPLSRARRAYYIDASASADKNPSSKKRLRDVVDTDPKHQKEIEATWKKETQKEMEKMKEEYGKLKQRAILGDRTKVVALKRIEEVRSAVYNLFGWSMKVSGAVYALSSIYAESPLEVLHFCVNEEGGMSLMDCEYAQRLTRELEQYVERMDSFPALLADITMTNFEKSTMFRA